MGASEPLHSEVCFAASAVHKTVLHLHYGTSTNCLGCAQLPYSRLIHGLEQENIRVNRKVLSELAMQEPHSFRALVEQVPPPPPPPIHPHLATSR